MANEETQEPVTEVAEQEVAVKTAFLVLILENDDISIQTHPEVLNFPIVREATGKDLRRAALEIAADLAAQSAAQYTIAGIQSAQ